MEEAPDVFLVANTLTGALIRLNRHTLDEVVRIFNSKIIKPGVWNPDLFSLLCDNGFIIVHSVDELALLKERHWTARNGVKALGLAVGVTQQCNFACTYCYQNHLPIDLSDDAQQGICEYVTRELPGREVLKVAWWGGEPLLRLDIIHRLSDKLRDLCSNFGCEYTASITTNGYLLSEDAAKLLVHLGVCDIQVTLDGPQEIHDRRRYLKGGRGSFDRILNNLSASAYLFDRVIVRVNIDRHNAESIEDLLTILEPLKQWIVIAFRAATSPETPERSDLRYLSAPDYWKLEDKFYAIASQKGFRSLFGYSMPGTSFCAGYQRSTILIDANGDVHRCPICTGRSRDRMGVLNKNGTISDIGGLQSEWDNWSPFEDAECRECIALPLCMGGCLWYLKTPKEGSLRCFAKRNIVERMKHDAKLADLSAIL